MIKLARKYSFDKYGKGRGTILTLNNSFHGRTITTLAATGQEVFHNYFFPFTEGFRYAGRPTTWSSLEEVAGHDVCAVMLELVQGEGGVLPLEQDFVHEVAELCSRAGLAAAGGRGADRHRPHRHSLLPSSSMASSPDVVSFAKGIAGGLPMGGILANEKCRDVLGPGTHATTFGGNPGWPRPRPWRCWIS